MTTATDRSMRTHIYRAFEQQVSGGAVRIDDALTAVIRALGEPRDLVVAAMWDLVDLGSIDYGVDGRLRPTALFSTDAFDAVLAPV